MNLPQEQVDRLIAQGAVLGPRAVFDAVPEPKRLRKPPAPKAFVEPGISVEEGRLTILVPSETKSEANQREHWAVKARRSKSAKVALWTLLQPHHGLLTPLVAHLASDGALRVTFTRLGGRELDGDNLQGAFKALRDATAASLLVDDRDPRVHWKYDQESGSESGVRIEIEVA